jgi:hypothetical protein
MDSGPVKIAFEFVEFSLQIPRIPVEHMVEIFATDCTDEPFHERM